MSWVAVLIGIVGGVLLLWLALVATPWIAQRGSTDPTSLREALRLLPDVIGLLRGLVADPTVPSGVRIRLGLLMFYLVLPIDLIPDFVPVLGYADDAIIVAVVVRSVARRAGPDALNRHWPGTASGLDTLKRFAGIPAG